jgi:hypothetical protein
MRDVQRRFALPWSIYSFGSMASSSWQCRGKEDTDAMDGILESSN